MISPELLRRYPFFSILSESQLKGLAMLGEEISLDKGEILFEAGKPSDTFYFLLAGGIDLYYQAEEEFRPQTKKEFLVGEVNPGEVVAFTPLIEPYRYNATAKVSQPSRLIAIDAKGWRAMIEIDPELGCKTMTQLAKAVIERLIYTRIQLAAAWSEKK